MDLRLTDKQTHLKGTALATTTTDLQFHLLETDEYGESVLVLYVPHDLTFEADLARLEGEYNGFKVLGLPADARVRLRRGSLTGSELTKELKPYVDELFNRRVNGG